MSLIIVPDPLTREQESARDAGLIPLTLTVYIKRPEMGAACQLEIEQTANFLNSLPDPAVAPQDAPGGDGRGDAIASTRPVIVDALPPPRQRAFISVTLPEDPRDPPLEPDAWIPEDSYDARQRLYAGSARHD